MNNQDETKFLESLHPNLSNKYKDIQKKTLFDCKEKFEEKKDVFIKNIETGISTDKDHRDLVNLCVFPFSKRQFDEDLNYNFIRAEPLWELKVKNFDFLLCNFEKELLIFGESKSSIYNYADVIKEAAERRQIVEQNMDYIVKEYLGFKPKYIEYVIGVYSSDDEELIKQIIKHKSELKVWSIDRYKKLLSLRSFQNISEEEKRNLEHNHTRLNSLLKRIPTDTGGYDMFPSSHAITLLRQLILTKEKEEKDLIVSPSIIKEKVKSDIFYFDEKYQTDISAKIINYAEEIGFIEPISEKSIEYRIVSNYRHDDGLEKDLIKKYINFKIRAEEIKHIEYSHTVARDTIENELKKQLTFDKF